MNTERNASHNGESRTRPREIADQITRAILNGVYPTGTKLPTERELSVQFNTNRNVVREALKRLEALQLVTIRQGSGIYVQDVQLGSSVVLFDVLMRHEDGSVNVQFVKDVLEFRARVSQMLVRAAAVRHTAEELAELRRLTAARRAAMDDMETVRVLTRTAYDLVAQSTHNRVYQFVYNTTAHVMMQLWEMLDLPLLGMESLQDTLERLVDAFEHRDGAMAELLMLRQAEQFYRLVLKQPLPDGIVNLQISGIED